ncbi:beta-glucosidase family protein [Pseudomonas oryzihabitans]|uniref:Beta-glucosidase n=1 Tax=Pseudomonas oryzihabitans TaxID=47885 RepID=A0AAJ2BMD8_9PSED|nr:glycoside hydrolase family 3 C-terminal domain-containing protein [Pseudomonas psychrotolerans]MDR6232837.1 beta-glucosidase [Pseudomonas psychrotolerans]
MKNNIPPYIIAVLASAMASTHVLAASQPWLDSTQSPDQRSMLLQQDLTLEEQIRRVHGEMAMPILGFTVPEGAIGSAGFVPADPARGIPALQITDASLGVANPANVRPGDGGTPLPSGLSSAASWNPAVAYDGGRMIGQEAWSKGFNVMLAGGVNLARDPRNGRNFEYFGEDPLLAGTMAGESIRGIQSQHVLSTIKHFAMNDQETARMGMNAVIDERPLTESDLLAFQFAIERGQPGAVMCGYNRVNGRHACDNAELLQRILKNRWGYRGFVMSDWGSVHSVEAAMHGVDIEMGTQLDKWLFGDVFFEQPLLAKAEREKAYRTRLEDMSRRVLRSMFDVGLFEHPPVKTPIDYVASKAVAQRAAEEGMVLLRNEKQILPLKGTGTNQRILVVGGNADKGVLSGAGSSQVVEPEGPGLAIHSGGEGQFASLREMVWHRSSPLKALKAELPDAVITFNDGRNPGEAAALAKNADVVIVFATQWMMESYDTFDLELPSGQNDLIDAVASANVKTVVVLETGGPVSMPWLKKTGAVVQAWYPGAGGGEAIARTLTGKVNPSGRLPITFPADIKQLPRPVIPGFGGPENAKIDVDYNVEGADVGYKWFARKAIKPLFPFGFGLSYTKFKYDGLNIETTSPLTVSFKVTNTGPLTGQDVPQLYLTRMPGRAQQRLLGWDKIELRAGESRSVTLQVDSRLLADFDVRAQRWSVAPGDYAVALGHSATDLVARQQVDLSRQDFADPVVSH